MMRSWKRANLDSRCVQTNLSVTNQKIHKLLLTLPRALLGLILVLGASDAVAAVADDQIGFALGYDHWNYKVSGLLVDEGTELRLHRDLGLKPINNDNFFLRLDTGAGWWRPDLSASYMRIVLDGSEPISGSALQLGSLNLLPVTATVLTNTGINDSELTFSYPLPISFLGSLKSSAGLTLKYLNGDLNIQQAGGGADVQKVNEFFPLIHLDLNLPLGRFVNLTTSGNWIQYAGEGAYEYSGGIEFRMLGPITLSARWQQKHYSVDDGYTLHANLRGALLGVHLVFE
jgi:hypothetical protein